MKIERKDYPRPLVKTVKKVWALPGVRILFFLGCLMAAFLAGALIYRKGYLHNVLDFTKRASTQVVENIETEVEMYISNGLPTLYIDLPFESYQSILEKREEALRTGILLSTDEDFVPAQVHLGDTAPLDVKIRLKGDWTDHLEGEKWSYRIHVKDDGQIDGFRRFSIQAPETRQFINEWAFHQHLMREDILTTRYQFVNVLQNGLPKGIYALEESFTSDLIESQHRRAGVIIRFDENLFWEDRATFWEHEIYVGSKMMVTNADSSQITTFESGKIAENPVLDEEAQTAIDMLRAFQIGERTASETFDVKLMGRFYALSDLWGAAHGVKWHNLRFYYNPITGLLEPVAYDNEALQYGGSKESIIDLMLNERIFEDPLIREAYAQELERITQPDYLTSLKEDINDELELIRTALKAEYTDQEIESPWSILDDRSVSLRLHLRPAQAVRGNYVPLTVINDQGQEEKYLQVDLTNLMLLPVDLDRFLFNGEEVVPTSEWITPETMNLTLPDSPQITLQPVPDLEDRGFQPVRFLVPYEWKEDDFVGDTIPFELSAVVRLSGLSKAYTIPLELVQSPEPLLEGPKPAAPTVEEALAQYPFLRDGGDEHTLVVEPGDWTVQGDLIVPDGMELVILQGTTLRFEPGAVLLSSGPVQIAGTEAAPVLLTAQEESWAGLVVLEAGEVSQWEYAQVEHTTGIERDGWVLTGGITFFQSPVTLNHTRILHTQAEDGINVVRSELLFQNSEFGYTASDAFDGDFVTGQVMDCSFHDIVGDGVDVSGSNVTVDRTHFVNVADKGISAGEDSEISVHDVQAEDVGIGVASKDLSSVSIDGMEITRAIHAGLAAYIKKPVYGPASIIATNIYFNETNVETLVQTGNFVEVWGKQMETQDLDVDTLYAIGVLGN